MPTRRTTLISSVVAAFFLLAGTAQALTIKPFTTADFAAAQTAGKPVAVHFHADWCPTCRAQDKALETLKSDPALKDVTLLQANYDTEKALKQQMGIRTQSTFVVFKGKTEVARSAGVTEAGEIHKTLATGL
ncbi:MAG: thioredoxin family protein [Polaromonas sp.]